MAKKVILGIDIGYDQLKLALVNNGTVVKTAMAQMPENLLREGRITAPDTMAGMIRDLMRENGMRTNRAAVVLPHESVYVKNVDVPVMTEEQLAYNLPFEFHDYITGEIKDYVFDYAVIGRGKAEPEDGGEFGAEGEEEDNREEVMNLMAVGVERSLLDELQSMLRKAGLKMVKTAPALCSYISLIREMHVSLSLIADEYAILDLGYHAITMYMYKGDRHVATREFELGLSALDDILAEKFGVDRHLAHTYVLNNFEDCLESEECAGFYDNIAVELMRALNFYEFSNQDSNLNDLWLCGGGAVNRPLIRMIYETLDTKLHLSHELLPDGKNIPQYNSFVQAIGVALEI